MYGFKIPKTISIKDVLFSRVKLNAIFTYTILISVNYEIFGGLIT